MYERRIQLAWLGVALKCPDTTGRATVKVLVFTPVSKTPMLVTESTLHAYLAPGSLSSVLALRMFIELPYGGIDSDLRK